MRRASIAGVGCLIVAALAWGCASSTSSSSDTERPAASASQAASLPPYVEDTCSILEHPERAGAVEYTCPDGDSCVLLGDFGIQGTKCWNGRCPVCPTDRDNLEKQVPCASGRLMANFSIPPELLCED